MNTQKAIQEIKQYLIDLAVNDKLPLDLNALDPYPMQEILDRLDDEEAFGFTIDDVLEHAESNGEKITVQEAREVIFLMRSKGDLSVGISWDTIEYFTEIIIDERHPVEK